jgi:hypothetical protein
MTALSDHAHDLVRLWPLQSHTPPAWYVLTSPDVHPSKVRSPHGTRATRPSDVSMRRVCRLQQSYLAQPRTHADRTSSSNHPSP